MKHLKWVFLAILAGGTIFLSGCATPVQSVGLGIGLATAAGGRTPAQELEQIYYLGVFDPEEQLPPTVYRLTVRGQASLLSSTRFASGWVPAGVVDSLNGRLSVNANGNGEVEFSQTSSNYTARLTPGRRLMMFGPEGFREAPRDHRLVIVMGASPSNFFEAIDGALGEISGVAMERRNASVEKELYELLISSMSSRNNLGRLKLEVAEDLKRGSSN